MHWESGYQYNILVYYTNKPGGFFTLIAEWLNKLLDILQPA